MWWFLLSDLQCWSGIDLPHSYFVSWVSVCEESGGNGDLSCVCFYSRAKVPDCKAITWFHPAAQQRLVHLFAFLKEPVPSCSGVIFNQYLWSIFNKAACICWDVMHFSSEFCHLWLSIWTKTWNMRLRNRFWHLQFRKSYFCPGLYSTQTVDNCRNSLTVFSRRGTDFTSERNNKVPGCWVLSLIWGCQLKSWFEVENVKTWMVSFHAV